MTNLEIIKKIFANYIETTGKGKFVLVVLFGIFLSGVTVVEPLIFTKIIKEVETFYQTGEINIEYIIQLIIFWGVFIGFSIGVFFVYRYSLASKTVINSYTSLGSIYAEKVIYMSFGEYLGKKPGSIYKIFDRGLTSHAMFLFYFFLDFLKSFSGIIIIIMILFYIDVRMALLTLSMFPIMIIFGCMFYTKLFPAQKAQNEIWDSIFGDIGNIMSNFGLVKTLTLEKTFSKGIKSKLDFCYESQLKIDKGWSISDIYTSMFVMISRILVLGFGVFFLVNGTLSLATLFLFFAYIGWIYFPLGFLFSRLRNVQEWITSIGKFYEEFDSLEQDIAEKKLKNLKHIGGQVEYSNVCFGYNDKNAVLENISFTVKQGESVAFVGNTGAGKSTIVNLLLRFWESNSGEIKIDDIDITKVSKKSLRSHIGVVSQDNSLFNLSIRENLLYANPKSTKKELDSALNKANANFVFDLENGLDTVIGERGLKLSGGEKQRLSIARLFLQNPKILVLDEATSALDNKTEKLIQNALNILMEGRTSIIIAHRLSTIKHVDRIFVLEKGQIVESGSYAELMKNKGKFYDLANVDHLILN